MLSSSYRKASFIPFGRMWWKLWCEYSRISQRQSSQICSLLFHILLKSSVSVPYFAILRFLRSPTLLIDLRTFKTFFGFGKAKLCFSVSDRGVGEWYLISVVGYIQESLFVIHHRCRSGILYQVPSYHPGTELDSFCIFSDICKFVVRGDALNTNRHTLNRTL